LAGDRWEGWPSSTDGGIDFLRHDYIEWACGAIRLPDEIGEAIMRGAAAIRQNDGLSQLAREFHRELFIDKTAPGETNKRLLASGPQSGIVAAVVYLGALPQMRACYELKRIPERVLVDTLDDMAIWMRHYHNRNGEWGLGQVSWLIHHVTGKLFRLGRLQFAFASYNKPFKAFRHRASGRVAVLCDSGTRYRADGQADGTNGMFDDGAGWTTVFDYDGTAYTGHPVTSKGAVSPSRVSLPVGDWELVLEKGEPVLDVHIPEGGKMTHELCRESYGQAVAFAAEHFSEMPFKAFVCSSWLLAPQFPLLLPADANIVRFQRDYYVTPVKSDEDQTLERVFGFGTKLADLPGVPRETSLQRIVYDHLASGGHIHGAAGFLLKDDWRGGTTIAPQADPIESGT
jgi:hypothetical protein